MSVINDHIRSFLTSERLTYTTLEYNLKDISLAYFEKNFTLLAAFERPELEQYIYYYRNRDNADLVMSIIIKNKELEAILQLYQKIEPHLKVL